MAIRSGGRFGPSRRVVKHPRIAPPTLAGNARGDLALAWFEDRSVHHDRVYVALRRAGHGFGKPIRLSGDRVRSVSVGVGPRGDVLVAWNTVDKVRTRLKRRRARLRPRRDAALRPGVGRRSPPRSRELRPRLCRVGLAGPVRRRRQRTGLLRRRDAPGRRQALPPRAAARPSAANHLGGPLDLTLTGRGNALVAWVSDRVRAAETDATAASGRRATCPRRRRRRRRHHEARRCRRAATPAGARLVLAGPGPPVRAASAPPEDVGRRRMPPGHVPARRPPQPQVAWQVRRPDGVHVQEATRAG